MKSNLINRSGLLLDVEFHMRQISGCISRAYKFDEAHVNPM